MISQVQFNFATARRRPLWPLEACTVLLDRSEDELQELILTGQLRWVWDIKGPEADRRELRIWSESVLAFCDRRQVQHLQVTEVQVYDELLPSVRSHFRSTELQSFFSASQTHVQNLIDAGLLPMAGHGGAGSQRPERGPNSFTRVKRDDVIAFLKTRSLQANL